MISDVIISASLKINRFFSADISKYQTLWFLFIDQCTFCARRSLTFEPLL